MEIENTKNKLLSELDCIAHDDLNPDATLLAMYRFLAAQGLSTHHIVELFYLGSRSLLERMSDGVQPSGLRAAVEKVLKVASGKSE